MRVKNQDLDGLILDWAVAQGTGMPVLIDRQGRLVFHIKNLKRLGLENDLFSRSPEAPWVVYNPSSSLSLGGALIEDEGIETSCNRTAREAAQFKGATASWRAAYRGRWPTDEVCWGVTHLKAAMRCLVMKHLGAVVDIPEDVLAAMSKSQAPGDAAALHP